MTSWWHGWTPTGAVVTLSSAVGTLALIGTGCWLCLHGKVDDGIKLLGFAGFSGMATSAVAARTRPDPITVEPPATITVEPQPEEFPE